MSVVIQKGPEVGKVVDRKRGESSVVPNDLKNDKFGREKFKSNGSSDKGPPSQ